MIKRYGLVTGLSDHTLENATAIASVALGACVIEKHFTLNRKGGGPDDSFSLEPRDLNALCREVKTAWSALGSINYLQKASEKVNLKFRRSLYCIKDIEKGEKFTEKNIKSIRPGYGVPSKYIDQFLGVESAADVKAGNALKFNMIERKS
jgi:N-acetylneuraminate synthase